ncbi:MAG: type II toxin-antitoxin system death-on-curing family toxin [Eubacteriales bacterium]|jgi:death-on-curing protein|nr:type II toxin-antitoxin system death-on-curing family toxin [Eubacteriales bacterium]
MKTINLEEVLLFHKRIVQATGGSEGIRDLGLIEGSLNRAFQTFEGHDLYKDTEDKIAAITYSLIKNHGFVDGNKRIGIAVMLLLLQLNNIRIQYTQKELIELGLGIADGSIDEKGIKRWIISHLSGREK